MKRQLEYTRALQSRIARRTPTLNFLEGARARGKLMRQLTRKVGAHAENEKVHAALKEVEADLSALSRDQQVDRALFKLLSDATAKGIKLL